MYSATWQTLSADVNMWPAARITWWTSPGLLRKFRTASDEHTKPGNEANYMWQSQVEIEQYSIAYFDCITMLKAL